MYLQQAGHQIILGSRKAKCPPDWLPQAEVAQINWGDGQALEHSCSGVDVVIQAAGMNAQDCGADPVAALEFNGLATARLLTSAVRAGVQRFIYLSTAHVYASPLIGIITEDTCPRNLHPYAASHFAGENAVLGAGQCGQIEGIVLRLSNAFGVPVHADVNCWTLLVNDLCRQAVQTRKLVLHTSGLQQRDFITLTDVERAVEHLLGLRQADCGDGVFNLGGDNPISVWDMAQKIASRSQMILGYLPAIERPVPQSGEKVDALNYSSSKLQKTGFVLKGDLDEEIDRTLLACGQGWGR